MEMSEEQEVFTVQRVAAAVEAQVLQEVLQLVFSIHLDLEELSEVVYRLE